MGDAMGGDGVEQGADVGRGVEVDDAFADGGVADLEGC
jgi:hypothetical protein